MLKTLQEIHHPSDTDAGRPNLPRSESQEALLADTHTDNNARRSSNYGTGPEDEARVEESLGGTSPSEIAPQTLETESGTQTDCKAGSESKGSKKTQAKAKGTKSKKNLSIA